MAHQFLDEKDIWQIIFQVSEMNEVVGLICKLCFTRNFRVSDVRFARGSHFRNINGYGEIYLRDNKMKDNNWYAINGEVYEEIRAYIDEHDIGPQDHVFEVEVKQPGLKDYGHKGVLTHEWINYVWIRACKELGYYNETLIEVRQCHKCKYAKGKNNNHKCSVYGEDNLKNCRSVHINQCKRKGVVKQRKERHPQLHESLRAVGAQSKIRYYMRERGMDYTTAKERVFRMSNWKSRHVFDRYMDLSFEREIGQKDFVNDFGNSRLPL